MTPNISLTATSIIGITPCGRWTPQRGGASNLTLCETNGGKLVPEVTRITSDIVARFGGERVGVHCRNDSGLGVAVSLAGIDAGASLVQGTMNGYGERVGNANW